MSEVIREGAVRVGVDLAKRVIQVHAVDSGERVLTSRALSRDKFLVTLGGEHSITPPLVAAAAARYPSLAVLQIDAHADLRDSYMGTRQNHACAIRRSLEVAPVTQVGIRSLSAEEARALPSLKNATVFYDATMRRDSAWVDRVIETFSNAYFAVQVAEPTSKSAA